MQLCKFIFNTTFTNYLGFLHSASGYAHISSENDTGFVSVWF